ncbi:MAG: NosD domain-containing protein [Candidatus Methanoperedens sp.]
MIAYSCTERGRTLSIAVVLMMLVLLLVGGASATTITVDDSGGADYTQIQDAINNATAGDTIEVYSGTYFENVNVNKQLNLRGIGQPVVDAKGSGSAITLSANGITLEGFTAILSGYSEAGIKIFSNNNMVNNNNASNNEDGIRLDSSSNNTLNGNNANSNKNGIHLLLSSNNNTLTGNNALNNTNGIYLLLYSNNNTLSGNNVSSNSNSGVYILYSNNNRIYNNIFNNTNNVVFEGTNINIWNTTRQSGTNIIDGSYLGGNFWANPGDTGFSQTCTDVDGDGICDSSYSLDSYNIDYLPLSMNFISDATPPASITNLTNLTNTQTYIHWTWTNPQDADLSKVMIYLDGSFQTNVTKGFQYYNATGLTAISTHTIATKTVDRSGNINQTWVNHTATTSPPVPPSSLIFAITPNSRNAQVGTPITVFMSVINYGTASATGVSITQASSLPVNIQYGQWNGTAFIDDLNTPIDMPADSTANFVVGIDATSEFTTSAMTFNVSATNAAAAPLSAVNTLTISASATPSADVIMMSTSVDVSTAVNTATVFALATTNVGGASATGVSLVLSLPSTITGLAYQLNETTPDGSIKGPATGLTIAVGAQPTFAVFLTPTQPIVYDPGNNRITLQLVDGSGKVIGAQSVAVSTT